MQHLLGKKCNEKEHPLHPLTAFQAAIKELDDGPLKTEMLPYLQFHMQETDTYKGIQHKLDLEADKKAKRAEREQKKQAKAAKELHARLELQSLAVQKLHAPAPAHLLFDSITSPL